MTTIMLASCSRWNQPSTVLYDEIPATATFGKSFRNFIFIGESRPDARADFNLPTDLTYIASHDYVFLAKFHGDGDRNWQHEAAKEIKLVPGPDPKVFPYIPMKERLNKENKNKLPNFNSEVKLRSGATLQPEEDPYNMEFNDAWYLTVPDDRVLDLYDCDTNPNTGPILQGDCDSAPDKIPYEPIQANNPTGYFINLISNASYPDVDCSLFADGTGFQYRSNLLYHEWIRGVVSNWMAKTSTRNNGTTFNLYDGIFFDASSYVGLGNDRPLVRPPPEGVSYPGRAERYQWMKWLDGTTSLTSATPIYDKLIGKRTVSGDTTTISIRCLNRGIELLLKRIKDTFTSDFPGREVVWNGFAETDRTPDSRSIGWGSTSNLGLQSFSNGSLNEFFCVTPYLKTNGSPEFHSPQKQLEEIEILYQRSALGKIFEKVNYKMNASDNSSDLVRVANFCLGIFAMGINNTTPGNAFFSFNRGYRTDEFGWDFSNTNEHPEFADFNIDLAYGNPIGKYKIVGPDTDPGILVRLFQGGFVVVNLKAPTPSTPALGIPLGVNLCTLFPSLNLPTSCTTATPETVIEWQSTKFFPRTDVN